MKNINRKPRPRILTQRRKEIVRLIAQGWSNAKIANHYVIQIGSISKTIHVIFKIAGVNNRKDLVKWGRKNGIVLEGKK